MKRKIFLIILSAFLISLTGCVNRAEPVYLIEGTYGEEIDTVFSDFKTAKDYGLDTSPWGVEYSDIAQTVTPSFSDGGVYTYIESMMYLKTDIEDEYGEFYSGYDRYYCEDESTDLWYIHGTDLICNYVNRNYLSSYSNRTLTPITEDEAKELAVAFIKDFYSEEILSKYTYMSIDEANGGGYDVLYVRKIGEYRTDDYIRVGVTYTGNICRCDAFNIKKYDELEGTFSVSDIEYAESKLREQIELLELENVNVVKTEVVTNTWGKVFVEMTIEYQADGRKRTNYLFASVN